MLNGRNQTLHRLAQNSQKGLVLFLALIALVAMSLAAAALIRSVDSGVLVAGNLAFKQSAMQSAETGVANAYRQITTLQPNVLEGAVASVGYNATIPDAFDENRQYLDNNTWQNSSILVASDPNDLSGNETRLILHRMCRFIGQQDSQNCLLGVALASGNSQAGPSYGGSGQIFCGSTGCQDSGAGPVVYRATVRVRGPRNTFTYLQAFIY